MIPLCARSTPLPHQKTKTNCKLRLIQLSKNASGGNISLFAKLLFMANFTGRGQSTDVSPQPTPAGVFKLSRCVTTGRSQLLSKSSSSTSKTPDKNIPR